MKYRSLIPAILLAFMFVQTGCSGGDSGGTSSGPQIAALDAGPDGTYYLATVGYSPDYSQYMKSMKIGPGNLIKTIDLFRPNQFSATTHIRKNTGTFVKSGETYTVVWTYETCAPVQTETFRISATDSSDRIFTQSGPVTYQLLNELSHPIPFDIGSISTIIEDVSCNQFPQQ